MPTCTGEARQVKCSLETAKAELLQGKVPLYDQLKSGRAVVRTEAPVLMLGGREESDDHSPGRFKIELPPAKSGSPYRLQVFSVQSMGNLLKPVFRSGDLPSRDTDLIAYYRVLDKDDWDYVVEVYKVDRTDRILYNQIEADIAKGKKLKDVRVKEEGGRIRVDFTCDKKEYLYPKGQVLIEATPSKDWDTHHLVELKVVELWSVAKRRRQSRRRTWTSYWTSCLLGQLSR